MNGQNFATPEGLQYQLSSARARLTDKNWQNIDGGVEPTYVIDTTNGYDGFYDFEAISNIISNDIATTITAPAAHDGSAAGWHMLDGRRLAGKPFKWAVYSADSQLVQRGNGQTTAIVDVSRASQRLCFLRVQGPGGTESQKLLVQ